MTLESYIEKKCNIFVLPIVLLVKAKTKKTEERGKFMKHKICKKYVLAMGALLVTAAITGTAAKAEAAGKPEHTKEYSYRVSKGQIKIIKYTGKKKKVTIPSRIKGKKVTVIGNRAFQKKNVTSVKMPNTVKELKAFAFYQVPELKKITLSKNIKRIPDYCFNYCEKLESIPIPKKVTSVGAAFEGCTKLKKISLPKTVTNLKYQTFSDCTSLKEVTMNPHMKKIDGRAFAGCRNLVSIGNVTLDEVEFNAFDGCKKLTSKITLSDKCVKVGAYAFANCYKADIMIPENIKVIEQMAFLNCKKLTAITIPADFKSFGVSKSGEYDPDTTQFDDEHRSFMRKRIGKNFDMCAYAGCSNVSEIVVKDTSGAFIEENGILYNKDKSVVLYVVPTYKGNLDFLKKVNTIGYYAMSGFNQAGITIPDNITDIRDGAFYGAKSSQISWNKNVKKINCDVFSYSEITSLAIPEGVEVLENDAIANCKQCKWVSLPKTVRAIYYDGDSGSVLTGMSALEKVEVSAANPVYKSKDGLLFKGDSVLLRYPAAKKGTTYKMPKEISRASFCFDSLKYLKKIELAQGGTANFSHNFMSDCTGVTVKLPKSFQTFPSEGHSKDSPMFYNCKNCKALVYKNSKAHKFFKKMGKSGEPLKSMYAYKVI